MRAEWFLGTAVQVGGYMVAQSVDAPDFITKVLGILAGTFAGALLSAVMSETATGKQRVRRSIISLSAGPIISVIALGFWPSHLNYDPREWIFLVAGLASIAAFYIVKKLDERGDEAADTLADLIATRYGFPVKKKPEPDEHEEGGI